MAAEYYRLIRKAPGWDGKPPGLVNFDLWNSEVTLSLHQLGFLKLLGVPSELEHSQSGGSGWQVQKFMTGSHLNSVDVARLSDAILGLSSVLNAPARLKTAIYEGLCEAMQNTKDHAYGSEERLKYPYLNGQWWMTGSVSNSGSELEVVFFDQGISIPASLPTSGIWEQVVSRIRQNDNDAMMIRAAVEPKRSSTGLTNRGLGLPQIQDVVNQAHSGRLRILSRKGLYIY